MEGRSAGEGCGGDRPHEGTRLSEPSNSPGLGEEHDDVAIHSKSGSTEQASLGYGIAPRAARERAPLRLKLSALVATLILTSTFFSPPTARATALTVAPSATVSPGMMVRDNGDGTDNVAFLPTFQRWDGSYLPMSAMNLGTGDWPYLVSQDLSTFTVTRLNRSFAQAKIPGATYDFQPGYIEETIKLSTAASISAATLSALLTSSYKLQVSGTTISLLDGSNSTVWQTASFNAWDSSPTPKQFPNPVVAISYLYGVLFLTLDSRMLQQATYPLYIDPTWTLKADTSNKWAGTLDHVTSDWGDHKLKIGNKADNFDDNTNDIWSIYSGPTFTLQGGYAQISATEVHASANWSDLKWTSQIQFVSCGVLDSFFRYSNSKNYYQFQIAAGTGTAQLSRFIGGAQTTISPSLAISTSGTLTVRIVARQNYFEVWWNGAKLWSGTDAAPPAVPISGNIGYLAIGRCFMNLDNIRTWDAYRTSGNFTSRIKDAGTGNVATQVKYNGSADSYNSTDLWINASSDNKSWGGWHIAKSMAAPGFYYAVPDVDQKRYYQIRAVLRTGTEGTPAVQEIDVAEAAAPASITATTNTGRQPWSFYVEGRVNAISGNLVHTFPGISFKAKGFTISLIPTYNSKLSANAGPFGLGTTDSFNANLAFPTGGNVTFNDGDGASYTFVTMGGSGYSPPRGGHFNLIKNPASTYTLWSPDGSQMTFNGTGKPTSLVDRNGNHLTLTYANGLLTKIADDVGYSLNLTYDASNRIKTITDPMRRQVSYTYHPTLNLLTKFTDPLGFTENYTYDGSNRLNQTQDRAGHVDQFVYDASARASQVWIGEWNFATNKLKPGRIEAYAISYVTGNKTTVTNAEGSFTTLYFNSLGNPTVVSGPDVGGAGCSFCGRGNSSYTWDGEFDRLTLVDGLGNTLKNSFDWMGNALVSRDAAGQNTTLTFNNVQAPAQLISLPMSITRPNGAVPAVPAGRFGFHVYRLDMSVDWARLTSLDGQAIAPSLGPSDKDDFPRARANYTVGGWEPSGYSGGGTVTNTTDGKAILLDGTTNAMAYAFRAVPNTRNFRFDMNFTLPAKDGTVSDDFAVDLRHLNPSLPASNSACTTCTFPSAQSGIRLDFNVGRNTVYMYRVANNLTVTPAWWSGPLPSISTTSPHQLTVTYIEDSVLVYLDGTAVVRLFRTDYSYDSKGNLNTTTNAYGRTMVDTYDAAGSLTKVKDFRGNYTKFGYDAHEFLISTTDAGNNVTTFQNDAIGRRWNTTTPGLNTSRTVHDADNRVNKTTNPMGNTTNYNYNNRGDVIRVRDANLRITQYTINLTLGGTQKVIDPGLNATTYVYNVTGNLMRVVDAGGNTTTYGYDIFHRQITLTTQTKNTTWYGYDAAGNRIWRIDANGNRTQYSYDKANRLIQTSYPNGQTITGTYDRDGNVVEDKGLELDEKYTYDGLDRAVYTQQLFLTTNLNLYVNYTYDANGNRLTMSGNGGGTYTWDANNRLWARTNATGARWRYIYDRDGHQVRMNLPDGEYTTFAYDRNGWLLNTTTRTAGGGIIESYNYTYDKVGNRLSSREYRVYQADRNTTYGRPCSLATSSCSQVTYDTHPLGLSPSPQTVKVSFRMAGSTWCGLPTSTCTSPINMTVTWGISVTHNGGTTAYNTTTDTVAPHFDLTKTAVVQIYSGDSLRGTISYSVVCKQYNGECLPLTDVQTSTLMVWHSNWVVPASYKYDKQYRLAQTTYADGTIEKFTYDAVGNRLKHTYGTSTTTYTYDKEDHLKSSSDGYSYTYDNNGNTRTSLVGTSRTTYAYDYENRLTSVTMPDGTLTKYGYSAGGLRTSQNVSGSLPRLTYYGYDLLGFGGFPQATGEYDASRSLASQNVYGQGTDEPLERVQNGGGHYYHLDGLGSVTSITNATTQAIDSSYRYDSFGGQTQAAGSISSPYRYTAREWDGSDGLNYHRARYYNPATGRFLSKDPSGMVDGTNLYVYAGDNPVNHNDPSGNFRPGTPGPIPYQPSGFYCPNCPTYSLTVPPPPVPGGPDWGAWAQKCSIPWALFAVGVMATALGLYFTEQPLENMALQVIMRYDTQMIAFAAAMMGVARAARSGIAATTMLGLVRVMLNFIWIIAVNVIAPELGWFGAVEVTAGIITLAAPGAGQFRMAIIATSIILGVIGLLASGCIVPGVSL